MANVSKIDKLNLSERTLELAGQGKTTYEIADILNSEANIHINQSSISRWLKKERKERKEVASAIMTDYINMSLPADLKILDELCQFYLTIFRDKMGEILSNLNGLVEKISEFPRSMKSRVVNLDAIKGVIAEMASLRDQMYEALNVDLKTRMAAGDRLHQIVQTKLRWVGLEPDEGDRPGHMDPEERAELEEIARQFGEMKRRKAQDSDDKNQELNVS